MLSELLNDHFKRKIPTVEEAIEYLRGTKSKAINLKGSAKTKGSHGKYKCACTSCFYLLELLQIQEVSH
ncbi:hypothetical protein [Flammeovirga aprica]|uniref:hypothetical protein n=1 Tax=Flammeovirga aprica TaxID=29528 RepID=UPI003742BE83